MSDEVKVIEGLSYGIQKQLQRNYANREIEINASKIQLDSTAERVAMNLYSEIQRYQSGLSDTEDVAMMFV